jgi:hypothetical protein
MGCLPRLQSCAASCRPRHMLQQASWQPAGFPLAQQITAAAAAPAAHPCGRSSLAPPCGQGVTPAVLSSCLYSVCAVYYGPRSTALQRQAAMQLPLQHPAMLDPAGVALLKYSVRHGSLSGSACLELRQLVRRGCAIYSCSRHAHFPTTGVRELTFLLTCMSGFESTCSEGVGRCVSSQYSGLGVGARHSICVGQVLRNVTPVQ